jgi:hypothetical protein
LDLNNIVIPRVQKIERAILTTSLNGRVIESRDSNILGAGLLEIYNASLSRSLLGAYLDKKSIGSRIDSIGIKKPRDSALNMRDLERICSSLRSRVARFDLDTEVAMCLSLVDFTPWNAMVIKGKLGVIDVEFCEPNVSAGYDLIHYVIQPWMMSNKAHTAADCKKLIEAKVRAGLLSIYGIEEAKAATYLDLYVIQNTLRSLEIYSDQVVLHRQAIMQIEFWRELNEIWFL